jgi:hypothetical protein
MSTREDPREPEQAPHPSVEEARQGMTTGHIRWVLAISFVLAAIALVVVWFFAAR